MKLLNLESGDQRDCLRLINMFVVVDQPNLFEMSFRPLSAKSGNSSDGSLLESSARHPLLTAIMSTRDDQEHSLWINHDLCSACGLPVVIWFLWRTVFGWWKKCTWYFPSSFNHCWAIKSICLHHWIFTYGSFRTITLEESSFQPWNGRLIKPILHITQAEIVLQSTSEVKWCCQNSLENRSFPSQSEVTRQNKAIGE